MIFLAFRHLIFRKRQSLFTLLGIFFGTAAFVIISGFFLGFKEYLTDQLVSGDAHIKITKNNEKTDSTVIIDSLLRNSDEHLSWIQKPNPRINVSEIQNTLGWLEKIRSHPEVVAAGFQFSATALITKAGLSQSTTIVGTDIEEQVKITNIASKVTKGSFLDLRKGLDLLVVGQTLTDDLGVTLDDVVTVTSANNLSYPMKIVGIFETGNRQMERATAYTSLATAQKIAGQNGKVNQISVRVKDNRRAAEIANSWKSFSKDKVESWDQANAGFLSIFVSQDIMRYSITTMLLLVAGFGIYNVLSMIIMQKRKEIAILRSMGFDDLDVLNLFLVQGAVLGVTGSGLGIFSGYWICRFLETLAMKGPGGARPINISYSPWIYLEALILGVGVSCIAAYIPSRSASRMTPIDIIRAGTE